jgi:catechol 2,3-dioxygenase
MKSLQYASPAHLHHMRIVSSKPDELAAFYQRMLDYQKVDITSAGEIVLSGPARALIIAPAGGNDLPYYAYSFESAASVSRMAERLAVSKVPFEPVQDAFFERGALMFSDPQGRRFVFGHAGRTSGQGAPARMQHCVFQTTDLPGITAFFTDKIGFTISDQIVDAAGQPTVVFLRSDDEHHALAFFSGSRDVWDHHCYETNEWNDIRDWADRFAEARIPLFLGPGRHGPGGNLFFMVDDPDGNRLEFSAEIEHVAPEKAPGIWPDRDFALNRWGKGWVRT